MDIKTKHIRNTLLNWLKVLVAILFTGLMFRKKRKKTISRMLSQDGQLVEISPNAIYRKASKINKDEIHNWIKN